MILTTDTTAFFISFIDGTSNQAKRMNEHFVNKPFF